MLNPTAFSRIQHIYEKNTSLLNSEVPYFDLKIRDLTFQNTRPLKTGAYPFVIRCLFITLSMPTRFL